MPSCDSNVWMMSSAGWGRLPLLRASLAVSLDAARAGNLSFTALLCTSEAAEHGDAAVPRPPKPLLLRRDCREQCYCVAWSKGGDVVITGSDDGLVKFWCTETGCLLSTGRAHMAEVTDIQVNASGTRAASSANDKLIGAEKSADYISDVVRSSDRYLGQHV